MNPHRILTAGEVDKIQLLADDLEALAEALRSRAVTTRRLVETGLHAQLATLRERQKSLALILERTPAVKS